MPREQDYNAFVLKRTDFGETDQIITIFTEEEGKLRAIVKAAKLPTSKLSPALQPLFKVKVTLVGNGGLPKVIRVQVIQTYSGFYEDTAKLECWYLVSELIAKALADGSPNQALYQLLSAYLEFVSHHPLSREQLAASSIQFQIKALTALGMSIKTSLERSVLWFSPSNGGFMDNDRSVDSIPVNPADYEIFERLTKQDFSLALEINQLPVQLTRLINQFVTYQLERELKTVQYLNRS